MLVDLALTPDAGGQVKCWQRLAEAAADQGDGLDLAVHFSGPAPRRIVLSPSVRYELLPPVLSTARLISGVPDHTDVAPWHPKLARALRAYDVIHTTDAFFCYAQTAMRFAGGMAPRWSARFTPTRPNMPASRRRGCWSACSAAAAPTMPPMIG